MQTKATTPHPLGWLESCRRVGEGVWGAWKLTLGRRSVQGCSCLGEQLGSSSKCYTERYHVTQRRHIQASTERDGAVVHTNAGREHPDSSVTKNSRKVDTPPKSAKR